MNDVYVEITNYAEIDEGDVIQIQTKKIPFTEDYYWVVISSVDKKYGVQAGDFIIIEKIEIHKLIGRDGTEYKSSFYTDKLTRVYISEIQKVIATNAIRNIENQELDDGDTDE